MKLKTRLVAATAALAAVTGTVALAQNQNATIGFLGGVTGPIENMTPHLASAIGLALGQINDQGGILNGGTISFVTADGGCDATMAGNAADRLVNTERVVAIVGGMCSGETIAGANNAAIPGNVVMISPASTAPPVAALADNDLVYRLVPSDAYQGQVMARLLLSKDIDEVVVTFVNNDYGNGFAQAFTEAFTAAGGTVAASAPHNEGGDNYRGELGTLAATGVQTLVILAYGNGSGQTILRQAVESGAFTQYAGGDGMVVNELFTGISPAAVEGMILTKPADPQVPGAALYAQFATAAGLDPTAIFAPQSYDAAFLLALAIEKNGTTERDGVAAALREVAMAPGEVILPGEWAKAKALIAAGTDINYEGATGLAEFDANGDVPGAYVEVAIQNGAFVDIGPAQ
jgi:branched-chain amino acid transport system substrate-binding protein